MSKVRYAVAANSLQDDFVSEWFDDHSAAVTKLNEMGAETHYIMDTESLEESRTTSQRARDLLGLAFPDAPAAEKHVFQDGRDFYVGTKRRTEQTVTAPMRVTDFDMAAARDARDWFVKIWCARNNVKPLFEGETF